MQRRRLALLALLAVGRARDRVAGVGVSREKLMALLWPSADAENGRRYLSDSVYRINQALDAEVIGAAGDELYLEPAHLSVDLLDFQDRLSRDDPAGAAAVYAGPFLDGFYLSDAPELEQWVETERVRYASQYALALETLGTTATQRGAHADAVAWMRRLAAHDPYSSRIALLLMRTLRDAGDHAGAVQHARIHEQRLRQELELEPDAAVATFAEELRAAYAPNRAAPASSVVPAKPASPVVAAQPGADIPEPRGTPALGAATAIGVRRVSTRLAAGAVAVATIAVLVVAGGMAAMREADPAPPKRIAVLPFANVGSDAGDEYFSDGITEELIATLGASGALSVVSRTSAFAYKNRPLDVREIGRQLGVDAVVEGSVRRAGRIVRVSAQLVSASDGLRLWSHVYDRELDDVFGIQEEIARAIVGRVTGPLGDKAPATSPAPAVDAEAYDLYLRGRYAWHKRTPEGLSAAIEFFQRAVARQPGYARAYVGLADAYAVSAFYDYRAPREAYPLAEAAARRALALDPAMAAAHATLAYVLTYYQMDWRAAELAFQRAIELDPGYSTAHQWYANLLTVAGRFAEAERELRLAQEADPLSLIANAALGWSWFYAGRYEQALEQSRKTLSLDPGYQLAHLWGGWALDRLGRTTDARAWIGRAVEHSPRADLARLSLAYVQARTPPTRDSARIILDEFTARASRGEYVPSYEIAKVYATLGELTPAVRWLERAIAERSHSRAFLRVDPQLEPLRGDARFERLVAQLFARPPG